MSDNISGNGLVKINFIFMQLQKNYNLYRD